MASRQHQLVATSHRAGLAVNSSSPLPKRFDNASGAASRGRIRPVTVDSGQNRFFSLTVGRRRVTYARGGLGGGAGRRSNGTFRVKEKDHEDEEC